MRRRADGRPGSRPGKCRPRAAAIATARGGRSRRSRVAARAAVAARALRTSVSRRRRLGHGSQDNVRRCAPTATTSPPPTCPTGSPGSARSRESMPALTAGGPGARPLPRLRPAQQRAHAALPDRVGPPLPRGGPQHDRRPGAALPLRRRARGRRRRPATRSASSSRSRSTPSASCGTPTAARAGPASSSGASAAPSPGSTSARANTGRPRRRSRRSCARSTPCASCRRRWRRCARPTPRAPGSWPRPQRSSPAAPGSGPGQQARTARSWRSSTRRAAPTRPSRARARSQRRARRRAQPVEIGQRSRPLRARRAPPPREPPPRPAPLPRPADLVGQLRRGRALSAGYDLHDSVFGAARSRVESR